jgi:hypothetical protein
LIRIALLPPETADVHNARARCEVAVCVSRSHDLYVLVVGLGDLHVWDARLRDGKGGGEVCLNVGLPLGDGGGFGHGGIGGLPVGVGYAACV